MKPEELVSEEVIRQRYEAWKHSEPLPDDICKEDTHWLAWRDSAKAMLEGTTAADAEWPVVDIFAAEMKRRLSANSHKSGWRVCTDKYLIDRLLEEVGELWATIKEKAPNQAIFREAADVANMAMMLADVYGGMGEGIDSNERMEM